MGGFFGAVSAKSVISDVFFGTDYHSHLGTRRAGMAAFDKEKGIQREIHNIENSPFRTKFGDVFGEMQGTTAIGCISDYDPQPKIIRSRLGTYAICMVGAITNADGLIEKYLNDIGGHFDAMTGGKVNSTDLLSALINQKESFAEGIRFAQEEIEGTASVLIMTETGSLIAARDKVGRLPVLVGKSDDGHCVSFESFAMYKTGYDFERELGPGEIVEITKDGIKVLKEAGDELKICAFLWSYYGFPTSSYEGVNVECMRYKNGEIMARTDKETGKCENIDYICGVPDSGTPHAIGYSNKSGISFARPFIKYTPTWARSFIPTHQEERNRVAKMKQIPVHDLIEGKNLMFIDDSIVRGTQMRKTVDFLYENGAGEVHMRSACPPIMHNCKYLNFSPAKDVMELITRSTIMELEGEEGFKYLDEYSNTNTERGKKMRDAICEKLHLKTLEFQSLDGLVEAIGIDKCKLCTYCWDGKE